MRSPKRKVGDSNVDSNVEDVSPKRRKSEEVYVKLDYLEKKYIEIQVIGIFVLCIDDVGFRRI